LYRYVEGEIHEMYADFLTKEDKERIRTAFDHALAKSDVNLPEHLYGELIQDRGTEMTFSALGQEAPLGLKEKWDPEQFKRKKLVEVLKNEIPDFEIRIGGTTSIDVTKSGRGKDYGVNEFSRRIGIPIEKMVYVGDALYPGGNDEPARSTGIECVEVETIEDTKKLIREVVG
jgi:phosphomannomutase